MYAWIYANLQILAILQSFEIFRQGEYRLRNPNFDLIFYSFYFVQATVEAAKLTKVI